MEEEKKDLIQMKKDEEKTKKTSKIREFLNKSIYIKNTNLWFNIVAIICISIFCIGIAPKVLQNDTFYTIPIGKYIAENGISNLTRDPFSWHNLSYVYPHWLYDFAMYLVYNFGGQLGIYISTMVLTSMLGVMIYFLAKKKSSSGWISLAIAIWALYTMRDFIAARAYSVTYILFGLEIFSIEKFLENQKKRYVIILVLIPLIIANVHSAVFPFYFVLALPYVAEYVFAVIQDLDIVYLVFRLFLTIKRKLTKSEEKKNTITEKIQKLEQAKKDNLEKIKVKRENPNKLLVTKNHATLLLITILCIAAFTGIINPAGNNAYTYLYKTYKGNTTDCINEHLPMTLMNFIPFALQLVALAMVLIFTDTKVKLSDFFLLGGLIYLSFKSRRQVAMFSIICSPILAGYIANYVREEKAFNELSKKIMNFACTISGALIIICCFTLYSTNQLKDKKGQNYINTNDYPVEASTWILNNLDVKNMKIYNEYNYGSYMIFRGIPVFIDSRADLYAPEFNAEPERGIEGRDIFMDVMNIDDFKYDYKQAFNKYGVTHVILYSGSKLSYILEKDANYKMLYNEGNFKIFERLNAN